MIGAGARERFAAIRGADRVPIGMLVGSTDPALTEIMGLSGFDFVIIDGEHSPMGISEMLPHIRAAESVGTIPLVRLWDDARPLIQKVLDIGAEGVVIPHVESAAQLEAVVAATRFSDRNGTRSFCPATHASGYAMSRWDRYYAHSAENFLVIPIIESVAGVENLAEIMAVDGVEYLYFGSGDLAVDLGVPLNSDEVLGHWRRLLELNRTAGKQLIVSGGLPDLVPSQLGAVVVGLDLLKISEFTSGLAQSAHQRFALR